MVKVMRLWKQYPIAGGEIIKMVFVDAKVNSSYVVDCLNRKQIMCIIYDAFVNYFR